MTENKTTNALQVLVLTPHIREHLKQHDPKAYEQALKALRETLTGEELERFEERLAQVSNEGGKMKLWGARIMVYLPQPHWSFQHLDGQILFHGPATPYLSRS